MGWHFPLPGSAGDAEAVPDPVFAVIEAHRVADAAHDAADREHVVALYRMQTAAIEFCGGDRAAADEGWYFAPSDLGSYSEWGGPGLPKVDVSNLPVPAGASKCFTSVGTHEDIDMLADAGIMYRGERERLHALNLRSMVAIDRLGDAADEALESERLARRALVDVKPTTPEGAAALIDYMGELIG